MSEEEQDGDKKPESPKPTEEEKSSSVLLEDIKEATAKLENENRRLETNIAEQKLLDAEKSLEGKSVSSGNEQPESDSDYADRVLKGEADEKN